MISKNTVSILLLDDSRDLVSYYKTKLERSKNLKVTVETDSLRARALAERQLFDVVVIDAKLDYKGFEFGGLRLADDLRWRFGSNAIVIMSRYITESMARISELTCDFLEKPSGKGPSGFERHLAIRLKEMRRLQHAFVAMPFHQKYSDIYARIERGIRSAGLNCIRVDKVAHNRSIENTIFELVQTSKLVVFLADGANPNAYYEAGFADAMGKEVIVVARSPGELSFDVSHRNAVFYGDKTSSLSTSIRDRVLSLRFSKPVGL